MQLTLTLKVCNRLYCDNCFEILDLKSNDCCIGNRAKKLTTANSLYIQNIALPQNNSLPSFSSFLTSLEEINESFLSHEIKIGLKKEDLPYLKKFFEDQDLKK